MVLPDRLALSFTMVEEGEQQQQQEEGEGNQNDMRMTSVSVPVCCFRKFRFEVCNRAKKPFKVQLQVQPFQDLGGGVRDFELEGSKMIWTGSLTHQLTRLEANQSYIHEIGFCFLAAGSYRFLFFCTEVESKEAVVCRRPHTINVFDSKSV